MSGLLPVLAASGEDPTVKLVIGAVVAVFWVIAQVVGALSKKRDKALPPSRPRPTMAEPPPLTRSTRLPPTKHPSPQIGTRRQQPPPPVRKPAAAYAMSAPSTEPVVQNAAGTRRAEKAASSPVTTTAKTLSQQEMIVALLKPRNLRKAYIVNEILQPPVSLR